MLKSKKLPSKVEANIASIDHLGAADISKLINVRAGRVASTEPKAQTIINQFNLINEEIEEGKNAAAKGDLEGVRDAVCDIVLLAFGQQGHIKNIDLDWDFLTMCAFNMTRIPESMEEAQATKTHYKELGVETEILETNQDNLYPVVCIDKDQWDINDNYYPPKKFVKSIEFHDAEFEPIESVKIQVSGQEQGLGLMITEPMVDLFIDKVIDAVENGNLSALSEAQFIEKIKKGLVGKRV